jgi:hypothetical protein
MHKIESNFEIDPKTGKYTASHIYDITSLLRQCYEERNSGLEGDIGHGKAKVVARIPPELFATDLHLLSYLDLRGIDQKEANKQLDLFLTKNPQYRTTNHGARKGL